MTRLTFAIALLLFSELVLSAQTENRVTKFASGVPADSAITEAGGKVGINTATPGTSLDIRVTYPVDTTSSQELIRFVPPNGHDPFQFFHRTTLFGNDQTNSVGFGFGPAGSPQGSPSFGWLMEDTFGGGNNPNEAQFELHYHVETPAGGDRPLTVNTNRLTGYTRWTTSAPEIHFYTGRLTQTNVNELHLSPAEILTMGITGPIRSIGTKVFQTINNGGDSSKQISIRPLPGDSTTSWLLFGNTVGGVSLGKMGQGFAFYRSGQSLSAGESHAYRYYAYGPEYNTPPLVSLGDGLRLAAGRAVVFSTTTNPEGMTDLQLTRGNSATLLVSNPGTGARATVDAVFNVNTFGGGVYKANGAAGVTVSGSDCKITQITAGIITAATCVP